MFLFRLHISKLNSIIKPKRRECLIQSVQLTLFCQVLIEILNKEFQIHFSEKAKICNHLSNTTLIFLCYFGSKVGIWSMIMLIQRYYQNWKQHVHSRLAISNIIIIIVTIIIIIIITTTTNNHHLFWYIFS